jgi:hypothetical protein
MVNRRLHSNIHQVLMASIFKYQERCAMVYLVYHSQHMSDQDLVVTFKVHFVLPPDPMATVAPQTWLWSVRMCRDSNWMGLNSRTTTVGIKSPDSTKGCPQRSTLEGVYKAASISSDVSGTDNHSNKYGHGRAAN